MGFIETEIAVCERRIKKIEENPDPRRLKSNKLAYELERDLRVDLLRAWREGQTFAGIGVPVLLLQAMGFYVLDFNQAANRRSAQMPAVALERLHNLRAKGFPYNCCDGAVMGMDLIMTGDLPKPSLVVDFGGCDPLTMANIAMADWCDSLLFHLDVPLEANNDTLEYVTSQLRELINFAESKVPGIRYDEDKLAELQEVDRIAYGYYHDSYEMRKHVPCPIPARDAFRLPRPPSNFPNPQRALEWTKMWRDEQRERVEAKISTAVEEKLRLLWTVTAPMYRNVFTQCEERGVAIPVVQTVFTNRLYGGKPGIYGDKTEYGRKLSPLEEDARMILRYSWYGQGNRWIGDTLDTCRDLGCEGIVNFLQVGCLATLNLHKLLADRAEKELGITTLQIAGAYHDSEYVSDDEFDAKLHDFIDMCLWRKGVRSKGG